MSNPLAIFEDLRDTYFRYLDSPFDLRYPDLVAERRALLDVDGRLYRRLSYRQKLWMREKGDVPFWGS
jgi:hypothetical protein